MIVRDEKAMLALGRQIASGLTPPAIIELVGDVGAGKTTLVKGIAAALGVDETVNSPSFVINKKYHGTDNLVLSHYDFYRLDDPGIMSEELAESISDSYTITIIEWAETVGNVLPAGRKTITVLYLDDGSREVTL